MMSGELLKTSFRALVIVLSACVWPSAVFGQIKCLSSEEVQKLVAQVNTPQSVSLNTTLSKELLALKESDQRRVRVDVANNKKADDLFQGLKENRIKNAVALCQMLKTYGWPSAELVGAEGVEAAFFLVKNSSSELQLDLLPVVIAAINKGALPRPEFPGYFDLLRLKVGLKQIFGTQATLANGFLVLYPIEAEAQVDARRKEFGLGPLAQYLRTLEGIYQLPLVRSTGALTNSFSESEKRSIAKATATGLFEGQTVEEDDIVSVNTNLVSLNVSVFSNKLRTNVSMLEQKDFVVTEDGRPQTISFFGTTDVPFDLVLLLDLSASTSGKRDLIRKSTRRFIEAARPADRLAIVTFSDDAQVVSPLTQDRTQLLNSINKIEGTGSSAIWDSLNFALDKVIGPKTPGRRRAVVIMTDGIDNSLGGYAESRISFADLLEAVRRNDASIIPICLDTKGSGNRFIGVGNRVLENARKTLELLADESGGLFYKARKIEDLEGVYVQVIEDLGKVYSLGYTPTNQKRDGSWRAVKIEMPNQPDLNARARPGYYAN
jgi:Ca-activated chloride channel family protein